MNVEMKQKLEELAKDKEFMQYFLSLDSCEKMSEELLKKDIEISPLEIQKIAMLVEKKQNGELSDEELENIAGGGELITFAVLIGIGVAGGILSYKKLNDK